MPSQPTPSMRVVLTHGHELLREVRLEKPLVIVGRDPACDIVVDDITISKRHMKLEYLEGVLYVEDLESTNGIKVNGHSATRQAIQHLDVVQLGGHRMHIFDDALLRTKVRELLKQVPDLERAVGRVISGHAAPSFARSADASFAALAGSMYRRLGR